MLDHTSTFGGTFHDGCIEEAIPSSLVQFMGMIEHGADIKSQLRFGVSKTDLVIAQLLQYNCYAKYKEGAATHRHSTKCVHARHTPQEGSKYMLVKASDTDILVIAISAMPTLQAIGLQQLWIAFGQGRNMRWIHVHEQYRSVGHEKGRGITLFHAFTG